MNKFSIIKDLIYIAFIKHSIKTALNVQDSPLCQKMKDSTTKVALVLEILSVNTMTVEAKNKVFLKYKECLKKLIKKKEKQNSNFIAYSLFLEKFEKKGEHYPYFFNCLQELYSPGEYEKLLTEVFLNLIRRRRTQGETKERCLEEDVFLFFGDKGIYQFLLQENNFEGEYISTLHYLNETAEPQYRQKIVDTYRTIFEKKQLNSALAHTYESAKKVVKL